MQTALTQYDVGVIVGRFQVHELHDAHRDLISHVCKNHEKVIILLGISPLPVSTNNPLDFEARKQMILAEFPDVNLFYIKDQQLDDVWSKRLDEIIQDNTMPGQSVVLYGSRDSFIAHYGGRYPTRELLAERVLSGTAVRKQIAKSSTRATSDFRAGVIWASQSRFPTAYTTVDIAILESYGSLSDSGATVSRLLLARKSGEKLYRFVGGFSDPQSISFEADAIRETAEETSLEIGDLTYIGSTRIEDWRYRSEPDCIKTMMFVGKYLFGRPTPLDDIEELRWFDFDDRRPLDGEIMPAHRPLMAMLRAHFDQGTK